MSQNVTYPSIVALADRVYEFASNSGGTVETSYYGEIVAALAFN